VEGLLAMLLLLFVEPELVLELDLLDLPDLLDLLDLLDLFDLFDLLDLFVLFDLNCEYLSKVLQ
jgi:hypothetical protein